MKKRTINGEPLANARETSYFFVRIYMRRKTQPGMDSVAFFRAEVATHAEAVSKGFERTDNIIRSRRKIWPEVPISEKDFVVTVRTAREIRGDELQVTRADMARK